MVTPPFLQPNDAVGIVSTARKINTKQLRPFLDLLESWKLQPVLGMTINASEDQYAGNDELRTKDFQQMLDNPNIKAIWCARGGYGTVRIIDALDFTNFQIHPKWIVGYSDITVIHSQVHALGIETLHGNMATEIDTKTQATRNSVKQVLFGNKHSISYTANADVANRKGTAKGQLIGGNLSILYSLCGSPSAINTQGKILFIEDLDEYLYHVDRMLQNIKRNGLFDGITGLIVGGMSDMKDNTIPFGKTANEIVWDTVKDYDFPVCFDFPAGHINDNQALIMGREATLNIDQSQVQLQF